MKFEIIEWSVCNIVDFNPPRHAFGRPFCILKITFASILSMESILKPVEPNTKSITATLPEIAVSLSVQSLKRKFLPNFFMLQIGNRKSKEHKI